MTSGIASGGHTARSSRTRAAIVEALAALLGEGHAEPNVAAIAARAGVSPRSVHSHFASVDDLHRAVADRTAEQVVSMLTPIDPASPFPARVEQIAGQRARVNERTGPLRRAASRHLATSPALAAQRRRMRDASRAQVERIFATELRAFGADERRRRVALADALLGGECWDILRAEYHLVLDDARRAVAEGVGALVGTPIGAPPPAPSAPVAAAARRLADIEAREERIVTAIEEGGPPDVLGARLRALHAERAVAEHELAEARAAGPPEG